MGKHTGKTFEKDLLDSFRSTGHWAERFTDRLWSQGGGSVKSPPDMIIMRDGQSFLMELKAKKCDDWNLASIPFNRCEGHQLERLLDFERIGGVAYVVVMFYVGDKAQERTAVLIPVNHWVMWRDTLGRKSLPLRTLRELLPAHYHMMWVGRNGEYGPWLFCDRLGLTPKADR